MLAASAAGSAHKLREPMPHLDLEGTVIAVATDRRHRFSKPVQEQVTLIVGTFPSVARAGHKVGPGELGENITTAGIDLKRRPLGLASGSVAKPSWS
jgi:hypothetical protein